MQPQTERIFTSTRVRIPSVKAGDWRGITPTRMRVILFATMWSAFTIAVQTQVSPTWTRIVTGLRAQDQPTRSRAADEAAAAVAAGNIDVIQSVEGLDSALLNALRDATNTKRQHLEDATDPKGDHFEGHEEYINALLAVSTALVPRLSDARQAVWLDELASTSYAPGSYLSEWLAERGDRVVDSLLKQVRRPVSVADAVSARVTLARIVAKSAAGLKRQPLLSDVTFAHRQQARAAVLDGLSASDPAARDIVRVFRANPSPEVLQILEKLDRSSRVEPGYTERGLFRTSLQEEVNTAIQAIRADLR